MGQRAAVASNHPAASQAGARILEAGGSAADAAAAISLALGVVEPHMSGLGGDGFYHHFNAATGDSTVYNGTGAAPVAAKPEQFLATGMPLTGPQSVSVPGALSGVLAMHGAHGRKSLSDIVAPAIKLAADGFCATHTYRRNAEKFGASLRRDPRAAAIFLRDGKTPALGEIIRQPELAATLSDVAENGADALFHGQIGAEMVRALAAQGGFLSRADLENHAPLIEPPLVGTYRDLEVRQCGYNSTGFALLEMLRIVEGFDLAALEPGSAELAHILVEAKKLAFVDRETVGHDGATARIAELLSDDHIARCRAAIDLRRAADRPVAQPETTSNTTYFCVVDADGNAVSAIQSLNVPFGSGVVAGRTGILLNNRMANWHLAKDHPNRLIPGRTVRHTMNAPMLVRNGVFHAALGTPGADDQVQVNLQAIVALVDFGADPQSVVEMPRWTSGQIGQSAKWPHAGSSLLTLEGDWRDDAVSALASRGHDLKRVPMLDGPGALNVVARLDNGVLAAAADPRRDGWAIAL